MIVVVAGTRQQGIHWIQDNIRIVACDADVERIQGHCITEACYTGSWKRWFSKRTKDLLHILHSRRGETYE